MKEDWGSALVAHEGTHVDRAKKRQHDRFDGEIAAFTTESLFHEARQPTERFGYLSKSTPAREYEIWNPSWEGPDKATLRSNAVKEWVMLPKNQGGTYGLRPPNVRAQRKRGG